jgi:hypothetical protein
MKEDDPPEDFARREITLDGVAPFLEQIPLRWPHSSFVIPAKAGMTIW